MAQPYVTGPVAVFVDVGLVTARQPTFLGHGERAPKPSIRRGQDQVMNDLGGTQIPFDIIYEGQEAIFRLDLTRWNEDVYQKIVNVVATGRGIFEGIDDDAATGSLYLTEDFAFQTWLTFPFSAKASMDTLPDGYHFFQTVLEGPDDREPGTGANRLSLIFHAYRAFDPNTGTFSLYDYDMSGLPPID